jgi:hypothetical protein
MDEELSFNERRHMEAQLDALCKEYGFMNVLSYMLREGLRKFDLVRELVESKKEDD